MSITPDGVYDANDVLSVSIEAQLRDVPSVLAGLNVSTAAVGRWTAATGAYPTLENVALPDLLTLVVEPDLRMRIDWHQEDQGDVSTAVPFAVTLVHADSSSATAYNISIAVPLPAGLMLRDGSVTGCSAPFCTATFFNNTLYLDLPQLLLSDGEQVVRASVAIDPAQLPATQYPLTASLFAYSVPDRVAPEQLARLYTRVNATLLSAEALLPFSSCALLVPAESPVDRVAIGQTLGEW